MTLILLLALAVLLASSRRRCTGPTRWERADALAATLGPQYSAADVMDGVHLR